MLTVENTGDQLSPQLISTLTEPFQRGTQRIRTDRAGVGLGLAIVTAASLGRTTEPSPSRPGPKAGTLESRCSSPAPREAVRLHQVSRR